ncbi:hypothetical protein FOCC_FOCC015185, partial [Frankliniella occidentalis]
MSNQSQKQKNIWKRNKRKATKDIDELFDDDLLDANSMTNCSSVCTSSKRLIVDESISSDKFIPSVTDQDQEQHFCYEEPVQSDQHLCFEEQSGHFDEEEGDFNHFGHLSSEQYSELRSLFNDPEECNPDSELKADLTLWSLEYKIGRNALTGLLHILRKHNHPHLPASSKTLLKTPRSTVQMFKPLGTGLFCTMNLNGNVIEIDVFVDGVSPYKSVKRVLWPICGCLAGMKDIFIIAMWCGNSKEPSNLALFLEDFIREANELMSGFTHLGYHLKLVIRNLIADAPARTWLKNVNQHGSYYACERCTAVGQWIANRMTYHPHEET